MEDGIFASLRKKGVNLLDDTFVNISASHDYWTAEKENVDNYYCRVSPIIGGPANVVVDGSPNTAYASLDSSTSGDRYILFDFKKNRIHIESFAIETVCCPSQHLIIEGSNNGISEWYTLAEIKEQLIQNIINKFSCSYLQTFSIIKVRQIGTCSTNVYRFHVRNIEFYGQLYYDKNPITYNKHFNIQFSILLFICIGK